VEEGVRRQPRARLAVVTPAHQSPLGVPLSPNRRRELLAWAQAQGSWVVEDDYDSEFRYKGQPLAALKSLDLDDRVIYAGSFSKMLFPGLRLGYLVVPHALVERFERSAQRLHNGNAQLLQATAAAFLAQGHFTRHLKKMRQLYTVRRGLLVDALRLHCADLLRVDPQAGGINLLARLLVDVCDERITRRALDAGLAMQAISAWSLQADQERGLLMGFTNVASQEQAMAIAQQLREVIQQTIAS
jgi:GntR family transcriptional regulator/MocR family aminotransferase